MAPGTFKNISYSNDLEDINNVLSVLTMSVYEDPSNDWMVCGGGYTLYSIFTNEQRYDIEINNGYILFNQKHYKFLGNHVSFEVISNDTPIYSFLTYKDSYSVFEYLQEEQIRGEEVANIADLENIEFSETLIHNEKLPTHEIVTEFGSLYIYGSIYFSYENKSYEVINENFSFYEMFTL